MAQPGFFIALFGEAFAVAQFLRDIGQHVVVIARLTYWFNRLMHGAQKAITPAARDIIAFQRGGGGQHDIGVARQRCPPGFLHDDGLGPRPGAQHAVQILMVMEGVATRPPDDARIGELQHAAIEVMIAAGVFQHFRNARDRDEKPGRVRRGRHGEAWHFAPGMAHAIHAAITKRHTLPRLADQAEHGGKRGQHPIGLLTIIRALQGPGGSQHRGLARDFGGQRADGLGGDGRDGRGPFGGFRHAIRFAGDIGAQLIPADATGREEVLILPPARQDFMAHGEQ